MKRTGKMLLKVGKVIGIILLIIIVLIVVLLIVIMVAGNIKNKSYYKDTTVADIIDTKYAAMGESEVSYQKYDADEKQIGKYEIWYPSELKSSSEKYPVVFWANGTGGQASKEKSFLKHLASWGFIVVGNEDKNTRTGASIDSGIEYMLALNEDKKNIFYKKIDVDNFGAGGHSQGGPAVFNAATKQEHGDMLKALYVVSATSSYHTPILGEDWEYDVSTISVPVFMAAGSGHWDAGDCTSKEQIPDDDNGLAQGICPLWSLEENYNALPDNIEKVYAIKTDVDHGDSYKQFDGYMTAWFIYQLKDDSEAGKAFIVKGELSGNSLYQDVKSNIQ